MKISVVINTYNADTFLEQVLQSVAGFDEIVICDMYSSDKTLEIASKYGCKIFYHEHTGIVEPARNFAISKATHEWVLVVDADEVVPIRLKEYLYNYIKSDGSADGLRIPRKNYFMGRFMHASFPNFLLRFFRKDKIHWATTVHTPPKVDGEVRNLPKDKALAFTHLSNDSINEKLKRLITYTDFEIPKRIKEKDAGFFALVFKPVGRFLHYYVFKGGFRDGIPGLVFSTYGAFYKFITISKIIEQRTSRKDSSSEMKTDRK